MKKIIAILAVALMAVPAFAKGSFEVRDFGSFKLHVYNSGDVMTDAMYSGRYPFSVPVIPVHFLGVKTDYLLRS